MKKYLLAVAFSALLATSAQAVDLKQTFKDADGKTTVPDQLAPDKAVRCGDREGFPCLTLGAAIFHALLQPYADEPNLSPEDKFKRGALAMKIMDKDAVDLQPAEVAMVKTVVGKLYSPLVIYHVYTAIDPGAK